jgi:sugar phosphate isomerase/epimerase
LERENKGKRDEREVREVKKIRERRDDSETNREIKRREFLQKTIGAAGVISHGALVPTELRLSDQPLLSNPAKARLGLVTYNLAKDWDIPTIIKNCTETGFEAVELRTTHRHGVEPTLTAGQRAAVRQQFAGSPVRLLSLGSVAEFHSPDQSVVRQNIEDCKRFLQLAHDIGALGVKVRPNGIPKDVPEERTLARIGEALRECGETARNLGVEVWVEVHGRESSHPPRMRRMMENANHPQVGICWNSNQEDLTAGSVKPGFALLKPWLRNVHINEIWKPEYPWRDLFSLLRAVGYDRYMLAEIPETSDPLRLMRYYRALWLALQP